MVTSMREMVSVLHDVGKMHEYIASIPQERGTLLIALLIKRIPTLGLPKWTAAKWTAALTAKLMTRAQIAVLQVSREVAHG